MLLVTTVLAATDPLDDPTHFDLRVTTDPPGQAGARLRVDPDDRYPVAYLSGHKVVPADFSDLAGGPYTTDDPGWLADPGAFLPGEDLRFRPRGALRYWDPVARQWTGQVPGQEGVRIFPGIPPEIFAEILLTNDTARRFQWLAGFVWTTAGISGPPEMEGVLAIAAPNGGFHSHLDFCLQGASGFCPPPASDAPAAGAYLIEIQLFSTATVNGVRKYSDSQPILLVLASGLSAEQQQQAVAALLAPPGDPGDTLEELPAAGVLILAGGAQP